MVKRILFYTKANWPLCNKARALLKLFEQAGNIEVDERDIHESDSWLLEYQLKIPVIEAEGIQLYGSQITLQAIDQLISMSQGTILPETGIVNLDNVSVFNRLSAFQLAAFPCFLKRGFSLYG